MILFDSKGLQTDEQASPSKLDFRHFSILRTEPKPYVAYAPTGKYDRLMHAHSLAHDTLLFCRHGQFEVTVDKQGFTLSKMSLLLVKGGHRLTVAFEEHRDAELAVVEFDAPEDFPASIAKSGIHFIEKADLLLPLIRQIEVKADAPSPYREAFLLLLFDALAEQEKEPKGHAWIVERTRLYIREHIYEKLDLSHPYITFGYCKEHIGRIFHSEIGKTLRQTVTEEKIAMMRAYLRLTAFSCTRIARILRMPSGNHLVNFFKYHTGMTPTEYRNSIK